MKSYDVSRLPTMITLGYDGENNWRPNRFDCSSLLANHPNGTISLWLLPQGESQAFPVALERDGNTVVWTPLSEEMTAATGAFQIVCTDGTDVGKSAVVLFRVDESILPGADHPAAVPSWATQTIERAESAADRAEEAAESIDIEALEARIAQAVEDYLEEHPIEAPVQSVNGKTGAVVLDAEDVGALPDDTVIPPAVTEQTVAGWGFTKNTGTYSKPSGGIPKSDLSSDVQTSLGKADTALQEHQSLSGYATETWVEGKGYQTAKQVQTAIAAIPAELPAVSASDNGKFLRVVNGAWAVKSDEGGSSVTVDDALSTTSENPVQNKVVKAALDGNVGKTTLLNLLIPILRQGLYGTSQEAAISALETALGGTPPVQTYVITNNLTNVTNSNEATAVNSGAAYTATLTPASGMEMQTVTVTMGGVDVTSTVYSNGTISIASVTGNIVITAVAESIIETYTPTLTAGFIMANGSANDSTSYQYTSVIPCRAGDKVYGTCENSNYPGVTVNYIRSRFTAAYDNNGTAIESAGSNTQADFNQSNPFIVPAGVYGVTFSIVNALANNVVVYVDKSERTGA